MRLNVVFHQNAWEEFQYWMGQDRKTLRRIVQLIDAIGRNPFSGIGKPEPLKGAEYHGYWSRRIDDVNRIVYKVDGENIYLVQLRGHYND
jgi:toxin YoeB